MPLEHDEQVRIIRWVDMAEGWEEICPIQRPEGAQKLYANANGGYRSKREAANLKREGVRKGVSDLFLPHPINSFHGLYIELKRVKGGKASKEQVEFLNQALDDGYDAHLCFGHKAAINAILAYFDPEFDIPW